MGRVRMPSLGRGGRGRSAALITRHVVGRQISFQATQHVAIRGFLGEGRAGKEQESRGGDAAKVEQPHGVPVPSCLDRGPIIMATGMVKMA
jgi:hypothetical protein